MKVYLPYTLWEEGNIVDMYRDRSVTALEALMSK
jgi:hypothetical protein